MVNVLGRDGTLVCHCLAGSLQILRVPIISRTDLSGRTSLIGVPTRTTLLPRPGSRTTPRSVIENTCSAIKARSFTNIEYLPSLSDMKITTKWWYSLVYTVGVFFRLTLKMEKLKYKKSINHLYNTYIYVGCYLSCLYGEFCFAK